MLVMPSNNCTCHLYSPGALKGPYPHLPYALDNGRFVATTQNRPWDANLFLSLLDRVATSPYPPRWLVVPDTVGDRDATLREWDKWEPHLGRYGWPLAMAVQDGMSPGDVPPGVVCFLGGTTAWKRQNLYRFCEARPRVHVGRINTERWLWETYRAGAESIDGTGWYRAGHQDKRRSRNRAQLTALIRFLERTSVNLGPPQGQLF